MGVEATDVDDLPASLREMAGVISIESTLKLVGDFGGTRIRVPASSGTVQANHPLYQSIGGIAVKKLCQYYAGLEITVPRAAACLRARRNREIHRLHSEEGWTASRIAREYEVHEGTVYSILSKRP